MLKRRAYIISSILIVILCISCKEERGIQVYKTASSQYEKVIPEFGTIFLDTQSKIVINTNEVFMIDTFFLVGSGTLVFHKDGRKRLTKVRNELVSFSTGEYRIEYSEKDYVISIVNGKVNTFKNGIEVAAFAKEKMMISPTEIIIFRN